MKTITTQEFMEFWPAYRRNKEKMPVTKLKQRHVKNCKLILDRNELLHYLPKGGICAEIGVDKGSYSKTITEFNRPKKFHIIDLWGSERYGVECEQTVRNLFAKQLESGTVEINKGYSHEVLGGFPDSYFDWVYIDTDHSYRTTAKELEIARQKVKKGGFIAGHDFVMGYWPSGLRYGVIDAVYEFINKYDWELIAITSEIHDGSFAIREITDATFPSTFSRMRGKIRAVLKRILRR